MIGASGISVKPDLYIGFKVSEQPITYAESQGEIHYFVNKDPQAKMFRYSDVGAVSDADKNDKIAD